MKKITSLLVFLIAIFGVEAQTYLQENFDTEIPSAWTISDEGDATGDSWVSGLQGFANNSLDGTNGAFVDSDANGNGTHLIETLTSPVFDTSAATALFLDFEQYFLNIGEDFSIVEVFDGSTWIEVLNQSATIGSYANPNEQHLDLTAYANANMQIRFIYDDADVWAFYWMIDNIEVYNSTCNFPSALSVAGITETTANLAWTPGGTETDWEIINQEAGGPEPMDTDSGTATSNNPYTAGDLTLGTNYEFYVRANCGADGFSAWAGPFAYRISGPGEVCENPIIIDPILPYTTTDNTSNYLDDYNGVPGADCGSGNGYLNGDDVVYAYTPTADTSIDIELTDITDGYTGIFVYTDCSNIGTQCESGALNSFPLDDLLIDNFTVLNGQTYYIVISTWATPQTTGYNLTITENTCIDPEATFNVVSDCENAPQFFVEVDITSLGSASAVTVSDNQGSADQTATGLGSVTFGPFPNNTLVEIAVANNDDANCIINSDVLNQEYCLDTIVDCSVGPVNASYCYQNNDTNIFTYTSTDGSPLRLTINSGEIEGAPFDFLVILDSDGVTELYNGEGNDGDLTGLVFQSTGDTIYFQITADGIISCQSGSFTDGIDYTVVCATCENPVATYAVVSDCINGPQFFVDVDITNLGSASSVTVEDNQGSAPQTVSDLGVVTFGPFANSTAVQITITNNDDANCIINSNTLTQDICLDTVVDCSEGPAIVSYCYLNNDPNQFSYTSNDGTPLNLTINSGVIEGAPFDFLVILDSDGVTELYNGEGNDGDISGLTFQSTGDTIYFQITSDGSVSCGSGSANYIDGIDYTVSCATCINPAATYQLVDDCDNGEQFLIDVNVTSLGDATSLTIANNVDGNTTTATATGIYQIGPFPFLTDVVVTISNDQDVNCSINSSVFSLAACPPENDNPCNAIVASVNEDASCTVFTSGTLLEATPSGIPAGSCAGNPNNDVWFQFTALTEFQIVQFNNVQSSFFDTMNHAVYSGSCDALVELYCSTEEASITPELNVGDTYFIRAFTAGAAPTDLTFDLCIRPGSGNVIVDQDQYTVEELVTDVLINSPCAQVTNITFSTGSNFGDGISGIGYFSAEEGSFPFSEGLVLTTGDASRAGGPNFENLSDGSILWPGDDDLDDISGEETNNATIVEFDFVPLSNEISFDFIMASEEYDQGSFECNYSDAFAFLLTDQNDITTNLAVLPGTTTPILVTNIHPDNGFCPAVNETFFGEYTPDNLPPISFDGRTATFTAFSEVNLGETYHIKLVIADARDNSYDSGVFLKAGSFDIGQIDLGADITVEAGTATCEGQPITIQTTAVDIEHVWYKDGFQIEGETSNVLTVTEPGNYTVQIIFSAQCNVSDDILIEFLPNPELLLDLNDIYECSVSDIATFDLTQNEDDIYGDQNPDEFSLSYYISQDDADAGTNAITSPYTNISNPQTIFIRLVNDTTGCVSTSSFDIATSAPVDAGTPEDLFSCSATNTAIFDLTQNDAVVTGSQNSNDFTVSYYATEDDATNGTNALTSPYINVSNPQVIYVRFEDISTNAACFDVTSFSIATSAPTQTATSVDITECDNDDDGFSIFDLDANTVNILNGQDASQFVVTYYASQEDADAGINALASPYESSGETIFVRVASIDYDQCYVTNSFDLVFGTDPITTFTEDFDYEVCPDAVNPIVITATAVNYDVSEVSIQWYRDGQPDPIAGENTLSLPVLEGDTYTIVVSFNDTGCSASQDIEVITLENCVIPQGISPNGDGMNDTFDLSNFKVKNVEIFNRYGALVYEKRNNYVNEWFGQSKEGDELPVGTYFYSLQFEDGERATGWVYIQREN